GCWSSTVRRVRNRPRRGRLRRASRRSKLVERPACYYRTGFHFQMPSARRAGGPPRAQPFLVPTRRNRSHLRTTRDFPRPPPVLRPRAGPGTAVPPPNKPGKVFYRQTIRAGGIAFFESGSARLGSIRLGPTRRF